MMRLVMGIMLAVVLAFASTGWAAETIEGKVQSVDVGDRVIVLEDGTKVWVAEGVSMDKIKEGASVKASFELRDDKKVATEIEVSE